MLQKLAIPYFLLHGALIQLIVCERQLGGFIKSLFAFTAVSPETHANESNHQEQGAQASQVVYVHFGNIS
jgi:hypothetical protein